MDHEQTNFRFGTHDLCIKGDVAWLTLRGDIELAGVQALTAFVEPSLIEHGYVVTVCDVTQAGLFSVEARRFMADWLNTIQTEAIFIGAGILQRTVMTMIARVSELKSGVMRRNRFAKSEAEVEALVPVARENLHARLARYKSPA